MPTKKKTTVKKPIVVSHPVTRAHDASVALYKKVVDVLHAFKNGVTIEQGLLDDLAASESAEVRFTAGMVKEIIEKDAFPLSTLTRLVEQLVLVMDGKAPTPAGGSPDAERELRRIRGRMAQYLGADPEDVDLEVNFGDAFNADLDLLNFLVEQIAGKKGASDDEVRDALTVLKAAKPVTAAPSSGIPDQRVTFFVQVEATTGLKGAAAVQQVREWKAAKPVAIDPKVQAVVDAAKKFTGKSDLDEVIKELVV